MQRVEAILRAAEIIVNRSGIRAVTIPEVAKVSLVYQPAIYQHLSDRGALVASMSARYLDRLAGDLGRPLRAATGCFPDAAEELVARIVAFTESGPTVGLFLFTGPFGEEDRRAWARIVKVLGAALASRAPVASDEGEAAYAAEALLACLRYGYVSEARLPTTAVRMAAAAAGGLLGSSLVEHSVQRVG